VAPQCNTETRRVAIPTKHPRIPVTNDPPLAEALDRVAPFFSGKKPATIVHDLAVKGAEAVVREHEAQDAAIERLIERSTQRTGLDWDALERDDAWGD
jgi:hypothetical protein